MSLPSFSSCLKPVLSVMILHFLDVFVRWAWTRAYGKRYPLVLHTPSCRVCSYWFAQLDRRKQCNNVLADRGDFKMVLQKLLKVSRVASCSS